MKQPAINQFREHTKKDARKGEQIRHVRSSVTGKSFCGRNEFACQVNFVLVGFKWSDPNVCRACRNAAEREARRLGKLFID